MHPTYLLLNFLLASSANALRTASRPRTVHEKRADHPELSYSRRLEGHFAVPLKIGLKQQNIDNIADHLFSISDPYSSSFGQHWMPEQITQMFTPGEETIDTVTAWLSSAGFGGRLRLSNNKAWIHVDNTTVEEVESLLETEYHVYAHDSGEEHAACNSYSVPEHISHHIEIITPTVQPNIKLGRTSPSAKSLRLGKRAAPALPMNCDQSFTPACARSLYNMTYLPSATDKNSFGIVSGISNTFLQSDLDSFFANFSPSLIGKSPLFVSIDGGVVDPGNEADVGEDDWIFQYAMTLAEPQPITMMQVGDPVQGDFVSFNEWLDAVDGSYCTSDGGDDLAFDPQFPDPTIVGGFQGHSCGTVKPPFVISNSRADFEYRLSPFYENRQCNEFAKLGLMGVTVLFSAGNAGAAGTTRGYCLDDNGSVNLNATHFNPGWPATCPWITAVGGTQVKANLSGTHIGEVAEEVWNMEVQPGAFLSGGGGFSNRFPMPQYQKATVDSYLAKLRKTNPQQLKHFNAAGRAYPDISANANNFVTVEEGAFSLESGTSGATPTVASIITLVNDARLAAGKSPVGFINPAIYSPHFAGAFNDIVSGTSQGCKGWQGDRAGGFEAVPGWDPASGVGTPNLGMLIEKWLALP